MIRDLSARDRLTLQCVAGWAVVVLVALVLVGFSLFNVLAGVTWALGLGNLTSWWLTIRRAR